jgi:hypothetical protein
VNVEIGNEASPNVGILVGTVNADLSMIVTKRSERGNQPRDGICVLITRSILSWGVGGEDLGIERNGGGGASCGEEDINVVTNNIGISVEDNVEVKGDTRADLGWLGVCCACSHIVKSLGLALRPLDWSGS